MIRANYNDKERIVDILTSSFKENKSVNYIIKQDGKRVSRIRNLMSYSFEICYKFGDVFISDDRKGCALIVLPDKKVTTLRSVLLDVKLIFACVGFWRIQKAMQREARIKKCHPKELMYYLWCIGVYPDEQNNGIGSSLLMDVIKQAETWNRSIYLETSTLENIPW